MNKTNNKKKRLKYSFSALLSNNRFLLVLSFIIAFVLWMWVAIQQSPEVQRVITDVPVEIKYEDSIPQKLGLQIFGQSDFKIDITVTGKKYIVSSLTADDFSVIANTNYADSSGNKTLKLRVAAKEENSDYSILSYSDSEIEVFFDTYQEVDLPINVQTDSELESLVPDGHKLGDVVSSNDTLKISGPATIVNSITTVNANVQVDQVLTKTTTLQSEIELVTNDGSTPDYSLLQYNDDDITVTFPVLKEVVLKAVVQFENAPSYYVENPISYSVYPSTVKTAIPVDLVDTTEYYVVKTIDFADIYNKKNTFEFDVRTTNSFEIFDDKNTKFSVVINTEKLSVKSFTVPISAISVKNTGDSSVTVNRAITVNLVGEQGELDQISVNNISIVADANNVNLVTGTVNLLGKVMVSGNRPVWAVGDYNVSITVK